MPKASVAREFILALPSRRNRRVAQTQANAIIWKDSAAGLQDTDADGEKVAVEAIKLYLSSIEDINDAFAVGNTS